jgi:hypothetical protein
MGKCKFCGEDAGWFKDAHETCVAAVTTGVTEIKSSLSSAVEQIAQGGTPTVQVSIEQIASTKRVPTEMVKAAILESWSAAVYDLSLKEPLSEQNQVALVKLCEQQGFTKQQLLPTDGFRAACLSTVLWALINDVRELYSDAMVSRNPFNLKSGEIPIAFFGSVVYSQEVTTKSREGGYGGLSVRVAPGMYTHFGGFKGVQVERQEMKEIDYGGALLTTQSLYFGGDHTTFRVLFRNILCLHPQPDGLGFSRDTGQGRPEIFKILLPDNNGNPVPAPSMFGWFLLNAAQFLSSKA